jgi:hypothetical protein
MPAHIVQSVIVGKWFSPLPSPQPVLQVKLNAMAKGTHGATTTGNPIYDAFS